MNSREKSFLDYGHDHISAIGTGYADHLFFDSIRAMKAEDARIGAETAMDVLAGKYDTLNAHVDSLNSDLGKNVVDPKILLPWSTFYTGWKATLASYKLQTVDLATANLNASTMNYNAWVDQYTKSVGKPPTLGIVQTFDPNAPISQDSPPWLTPKNAALATLGAVGLVMIGWWWTKRRIVKAATHHALKTATDLLA